MNEKNLHNYQLQIVDHILNHSASGIFVEMGLGKTIATLTAVSRLMFDSFEINKVLVIAPKFVAENVWSNETDKWEHTRFLRLSLVTGTEKQRKAALNAVADIYIINRENAVWLVSQYGSAFPFDMLIIDELSSFKSPQAQRFKAIRHIVPHIKRIVGLTGTPAPNGLIDLWSQIYLLDQGENLGKRLTLFRDKYFTPGRRNGPIIYDYKLKPGADQQIHQAISGICISMKSADYLELPARIDHYIKVRLDKATMKKYTDFEATLMLVLLQGQEITAVNAAVLSGKLRQFANGAVYDENRNFITIHDAKLEALMELVEQANGNPVLIFYEFRHDLSRILETLKPWNPETFGNDTMKRWNNKEIQVLLAHPASAGHGLNLQYGGNTVIWFGTDWSLELYQQANARLYRQGQSRTVNVYHLITEKTIDEEVIKSLTSKSIGQESLMQAIKAKLANRKL
jgi:SNF2 family DNA or RNA helicase